MRSWSPYCGLYRLQIHGQKYVTCDKFIRYKHLTYLSIVFKFGSTEASGSAKGDRRTKSKWEVCDRKWRGPYWQRGSLRPLEQMSNVVKYSSLQVNISYPAIGVYLLIWIRKGEFPDAFQPTYKILVDIRNRLEKLSLTQAWSLRETDLYDFQRQLDKIDESRIDGNFVDAEGNFAELYVQRVRSSTTASHKH